MDDQFADLQYNVDNEKQDLKDLDTRMNTEILCRLTAIELELQQEEEDRRIYHKIGPDLFLEHSIYLLKTLIYLS